MGYMEVDQQANVSSTQSNIGEQLRLVDGIDGFDALYLDNDDSFDNQIDTIAKFDPLAVIDHWQADLLSNFQSLFAELVCKAGLVSALKQAWADVRMNFHRSRNHSAGNPVNARIGNDCRRGHSFAFIMRKPDSSVIFEH